MSKSRRAFLTHSTLALLGAAAGCSGDSQKKADVPAGAPPAFGTSPPIGPEISPTTLAEAEKLFQITLTNAEREEAARSWRANIAAVYERRTGPRKVAVANSTPPYSNWNPVLPGQKSGPEHDRFNFTLPDPGPLPAKDEEIAFAPVTRLSRWLEQKKLSSERLTQIYLNRIAKFDSKLRCVITLTSDLALSQAKKADVEIAAGKYRGPVHGIPFGVKDLLDTAGIPTTYGAEPFRNRIPAANAAVVNRLQDAGAVLIAKLSMGALALNDIWFGGQTMNPWLLEEGSSGSSAGPGGAMTLCWSLDKLGPMARSVGDTLLVLRAISGTDPRDLSNVPSKLDFDALADVRGLRVGYFPAWMKDPPSTDVDRNALEIVAKLGMVPVEVSLPDWPYDSLDLILFAEAAAAFEELTLSHAVDQLKIQVPDAWPNIFRQSRFLSAVDFVQTDRFRRAVAVEMARIFSSVDLLLVPSLRDEMLTISNFTGHPSLTLRAGFVNVMTARSDWAPDPAKPRPTFSPARRVPHGVTLIGRLFEEGTLGRAGLALEKTFQVAGENPPGF